MGLRGELGISTDRPFNKSCNVAAEPAWSCKGQKDSKVKQQQKTWILDDLGKTSKTSRKKVHTSQVK
jgi:hypothetical protein